jgi:hypothetical protein
VPSKYKRLQIPINPEYHAIIEVLMKLFPKEFQCQGDVIRKALSELKDRKLEQFRKCRTNSVTQST